MNRFTMTLNDNLLEYVNTERDKISLSKTAYIALTLDNQRKAEERKLKRRVK